MTISEIVAGKRIFKELTEKDYRYLILNSSNIKKCIHFDYLILIKHGDLKYLKNGLDTLTLSQ